MDAHTCDSRVEGEARRGYEGLVRAFADSVIEPERSGAALSVWLRGEEVANIWSGTADPRDGRPWDASTGSVLFSASKGLCALVVGRLVDQGLIDLDRPLAELWPEFGARGKDAVSIGDVLAHRGGLSAPDRDLTLAELADRGLWSAQVAAQAPLWRPGTGHAYHAISFGLLAEEVVRRACGRDLHQVFAEEVAAPLAADITLAPSRQVAGRAAWLSTSPAWQASAAPADLRVARATSLGGALPVTLVDGDRGFNDLAVRMLGLSATGAIGTASALARVWSAAITPTLGLRLVSETGVAQLCRPRSEGRPVFDEPGPYPRWGAGVALASDAAPYLPRHSFGHSGAGGQHGFADPSSGLAVAYLRNRLDETESIPGILAAVSAAVGSSW